MARIRTIKPEFWTDEKLSLLDVTTRLVYLGLIGMADDAGRLVDNLKLLDGQLFPNTDDTCRDALDTLAKMGRILRYRSESGQALIQIVRWESHQKVDKPSKYVLPGPSDAAIVQSVADVALPTIAEQPPRNTRETVASVPGESRAPTLDLGPTTNDQRSWSSGAHEDESSVADKASAESLRNTAGDHWPDVRRFLESRKRETRPAWIREMAKLIGPGSQFSPADLAGACSDALALEDPLSGPHALRAFIAKCALERTSAATAAAIGGPGRGHNAHESIQFVGQIKRLIRRQGASRFIPRNEVEKIGTRVLRAYDAVGGADRFLSTDPNDVKFLPHAFKRALDAVDSDDAPGAVA